jgi:hypothetical protein
VEQLDSAVRIIATYASPHAFAPRVRAALAGLGYRVVAASTRGRFSDDSWQPDIRIVDERHFDKLPAENYLPRTPVIVLGNGRPRRWSDPRVVGEIPRPAELAALYPLLQQALEEHPRRTPRTQTQLPARCTRDDRRWMGAILDLSPSGCLFQTNSEMANGDEFNMLFPLPRGRMVSTRSRVSRRDGDRVGMAFAGSASAHLEAIEDFVTQRLATARS